MKYFFTFIFLFFLTQVKSQVSIMDSRSPSEIIGTSDTLSLWDGVFTAKLKKIQIAEFDMPVPLNNDDAKKACKKLGKGWRLPNITELEAMYKNQKKLRNFEPKKYWSSSIGNGYKNSYNIFFYADNKELGKSVITSSSNSFEFNVRAVKDFE
jgi:hypothetical protein